MKTKLVAICSARLLFRKTHRSLGFIFLILLTNVGMDCVGNNSDEVSLHFDDEETICFFGDSITHGGGYYKFIELFINTRYPDKRLKFVNCGISGDTLDSALERVDRDLLIHNPDKVFVMFGMNDVGRYHYSAIPSEDDYGERKVKLQKFQKNAEKLVATLKKKSIDVILLSPSIYDETSVSDVESMVGVNDALGQCRKHLIEIAKDTESIIIDVYTLMNAINVSLQEKDCRLSVIGNDRVHPDEPGHLLMSYGILKAMLGQSIVSSVHIDAEALEVKSSNNCKISGLRMSRGRLVLLYHAEALPFPIAGNQALDWVKLQKEFNQEVLKIDNLEKGIYQLLIDGVTVGKYSSDELENGVDLGLNTKTAQYRQSQLVRSVIEEKSRLVSNRIRNRAVFEFGDLKRYGPYSTDPESFASLYERFKNESYFPYFQDQADDYMLFSDSYFELKDRISELEQAVLMLARPIPRKYEIVRILESEN